MVEDELCVCGGGEVCGGVVKGTPTPLWLQHHPPPPPPPACRALCNPSHRCPGPLRSPKRAPRTHAPCHPTAEGRGGGGGGGGGGVRGPRRRQGPGGGSTTLPSCPTAPKTPTHIKPHTCGPQADAGAQGGAAHLEVWGEGEVDAQHAARDWLHVRGQLQARELVDQPEVKGGEGVVVG